MVLESPNHKPTSRFRTRQVDKKVLHPDINPITERFFDDETRRRIAAICVIKRYLLSFRRRQAQRSKWIPIRLAEDATVRLQVAKLLAQAHQISEREFVVLGKDSPFWAQGNETFHQPDAIRRRMALRKHPLVVRQLFRWCKIVEDPVRRDQYVTLFCSCYKALVNPYDDMDARACARNGLAG